MRMNEQGESLCNHFAIFPCLHLFKILLNLRNWKNSEGSVLADNGNLNTRAFDLSLLAGRFLEGAKTVQNQVH